MNKRTLILSDFNDWRLTLAPPPRSRWLEHHHITTKKRQASIFFSFLLDIIKRCLTSVTDKLLSVSRCQTASSCSGGDGGSQPSCSVLLFLQDDKHRNGQTKNEHLQTLVLYDWSFCWEQCVFSTQAVESLSGCVFVFMSGRWERGRKEEERLTWVKHLSTCFPSQLHRNNGMEKLLLALLPTCLDCLKPQKLTWRLKLSDLKRRKSLSFFVRGT